MKCCLAQSKRIHLKIPIGVNIKTPAHFTANAGFLATMYLRVSLCIRCFVWKAHRRLLLKNKTAVYTAKAVAGALLRSSKPLLSILLPKKLLHPRINAKSQQSKPLAGLSLLFPRLHPTVRKPIDRILISNPFKSCLVRTWRGQASPLHFQKASTGLDIPCNWAIPLAWRKGWSPVVLI